MQVLHPPQTFGRCHFGIKWDKTVASKSPPVAWCPTEFHKMYVLIQMLFGGDTDGQIDWWSHKLHFPFQGKQAKVWWMRYENPSLMFPPQRFALSSVCWYYVFCWQSLVLTIEAACLPSRSWFLVACVCVVKQGRVVSCIGKYSCY